MGGVGQRIDDGDAGRMRAALRAWVARVASGSERGLRGMPAPVLLSVLCATAIMPLVAAAAGLGGVLTPGSGVL